jgi:hypothetical protein
MARLGRSGRTAVAALVATIGTLTLAGTAHAVDLTGDWILTEGPHAGTTLVVTFHSNHALEGTNGHQGVIAVVVDDGRFSCGAAYLGRNSGTGPAPSACQQTAIK